MTASPLTVYDALVRLLRQGGSFASSVAQLAAAEVGSSVGNLAKGVGALVAGLAVALIGLLFLLHGLVAFLVLRGFTEAASYGIVGGGVIVLGFVLLAVGGLFLRGASPVPHRAIQEVRALLGEENRVG